MAFRFIRHGDSAFFWQRGKKRATCYKIATYVHANWVAAELVLVLGKKALATLEQIEVD